MIDMGRETKLAENADVDNVIIKHLKEDIKKLEEGLQHFKEHAEPLMLREIETLELEFPIKKEMFEIIKQNPRKIKVDYEYEAVERYHELVKERQIRVLDDELFALEKKLNEKKKNYEKTLEQIKENKALIEHKQQEIDKIEKGDGNE